MFGGRSHLEMRFARNATPVGHYKERTGPSRQIQLYVFITRCKINICDETLEPCSVILSLMGTVWGQRYWCTFPANGVGADLAQRSERLAMCHTRVYQSRTRFSNQHRTYKFDNFVLQEYTICVRKYERDVSSNPSVLLCIRSKTEGLLLIMTV